MTLSTRGAFVILAVYSSGIATRLRDFKKKL